MFGVTTNNFFKNLDWAKRGIFSFSNVPLTLLTVIGLLLFLSSILLAGLAVIIRLLMPELVPKGLTTLLITCLLFGSLNIFATGLIGEYVAKIMTEVKQRPRLIRSEIIRNGTVIPTDLNDQKLRVRSLFEPNVIDCPVCATPAQNAPTFIEKISTNKNFRFQLRIKENPRIHVSSYGQMPYLRFGLCGQSTKRR